MPPHTDPGAAEAAGRRVWELTFDHSPVGMAVVGLDGSWTQVNRSLCEMLGYAPEQLMSMTFQDITHPEDLGRDLDLLQECLDGRRIGYRMVKRYVHADRHLVWGDLSVALVRDERGPLHFVSQILDISEQRADKARLESVMADLSVANDDLSQFAAVVSHDLKTPLATVQASLELIADALPAEPDDATAGARALAARAEAAAERMAALIDALLAYSTTDPRRRESQEWRPGAATARLSEVVTAALADVQTLLERSGAQVVLDPALTQAPPVLAAGPLIRTLLVNLVSNAVKYRDPERTLCIRIGADVDPDDDGFVTVMVANDGPAIAATDRDRLFALFARGRRLEPEESRPGADVPGFGIGLAACRRIVAWHGGRIWFADPETGTGVVVRFTLPRPA